jgi:hypothetical protein
MAGDPVTRSSWIGMAVLACAWTVNLWAPHKSPLVQNAAGAALGVIGMGLILWVRW